MIGSSIQVGPRQSWSFSNKDANGDGSVSFKEYVAEVPDGATSVQPADGATAQSLEDTFNAYDRNKDGKVDAAEMQGTVSFANNRSSSSSDVAKLKDAIAHYAKTGRYFDDPASDAKRIQQEALNHVGAIDGSNASSSTIKHLDVTA